MFLKHLHKTPAGVFINGRVLEELFSDYVTVFQAGGKDKFYIHLKAGIVHFFVGLWNILWIGRGNSHNALFFEETVSLGMGRGITTLAEFVPKDAGVSIASAHIPY